MALELGMDPGHLSRVISGKRSVTMEHVEKWAAYFEISAAELMSEPVARLSINDSMDVVLITFDKTNAWTLPVVDGEGIFMGFVRKSHVLTNYRKTLADFSDE